MITKLLRTVSCTSKLKLEVLFFQTCRRKSGERAIKPVRSLIVCLAGLFALHNEPSFHLRTEAVLVEKLGFANDQPTAIPVVINT